MLEVFAAWRTVLHVSEWTGISLGALAALAAVVWFEPWLLKPAIKAAIVLAVGYAGVLYGDATGRSDVHRQWDAARAAAVAAQAQRDREAEGTLALKYQPQLAALAKEADDNKEQADAYEQQLAAMLAKAPARAACELGPLADRLWPRK